MPKISTRHQFWGLILIAILLFIMQVTFVWTQKWFTNKLVFQEEQNNVVGTAVEEFRLSSRDLTRYSRAFCETKRDEFYHLYHEVLDYRNGNISRPRNISNLAEHIKFSDKISQIELFQKLGLGESELLILEQALRICDELASCEIQLMNLVRKGNSFNEPVKLNEETFVPQEGESPSAFAARVLYSSQYQASLNSISNSLNEFI
ncbi:MAG: hypothetical protein ACRC2T_13090, partial [Thermoguttaceae bacterium]